jgi:hypothetical protein
VRNLFLIAIFALIMPLIGSITSVYGAPDPKRVTEIKEDSPLHIVGSVTSDIFIRDVEKELGYPAQIRSIQLKVEKIIKKPQDLILTQGGTLTVTYHYIPSWVSMAGAAKMDIMVGDQIEVWLKKGANGWEPSLSGNTVNHIIYIEPRKEPIPEPFFHLLKGYSNMIYAVLTFAAIFIVPVFFIRKLQLMRSK